MSHSSPGAVATAAASSPPAAVIVNVQGRSLLVPQTTFSRAVVMGNTASSSSSTTTTTSTSARSNRTQLPQRRDGNGRPLSNLSVLMQQQQQQQQQQEAAKSTLPSPPGVAPPPRAAAAAALAAARIVDEADSASGPVFFGNYNLGSSDPMHHAGSTSTALRPMMMTGAPAAVMALSDNNNNDAGKEGTAPKGLPRQFSMGAMTKPDRARRCLSSKELMTLAPPSGSPYAAMIHQKEEIESKMRQRMMELMAGHSQKQNNNNSSSSNNQSSASKINTQEPSEESTSSSTTRKREGANESRNRRRSQHCHAVVDDLCQVVADLFLAESKLIKPGQYGVPTHTASPEQEDDDNHLTASNNRRNQVVEAVQNFVAALPTRYALGADTPSEVLLHMRLMAAARTEKTKAVIHIHSLQDDSHWNRKVASLSAERQQSLRLVTICCSDANGLLELITKNLSSCGSRVLDADVMLSADGIALDRFVVEMTGRLRLDKLSHRIESFLKHSQAEKERSSSSSSNNSSNGIELSGSIYFNETKSPHSMTAQDIQEDLKTAVPLLDVLEQQTSQHPSGSALHLPQMPVLRKTNSMPPQLESRYQPLDRVADVVPLPSVDLKQKRCESPGGVPLPPCEESPKRDGIVVQHEPTPQTNNNANASTTSSTRQRRPLVNRSATYDLDGTGYTPHQTPTREPTTFQPTQDYLTVPADDEALLENRMVPLIPFEELMLIETIGTGRVSTIYRAVWQRRPTVTEGELANVRMVALKVAMVNGATGDTSHVDEVRREADIAARLSHPNVCALSGVAADSECFCLAYDYCEGGSLHSLLSDSSRYYEYLPIALDVANGMAYLHSRNIIHRDLKPSNVLLTRDHRAKICDFGMSVMNQGQELTAETGTYRYMAPEVIRHESYSSNADVYSFGICLWQLITREVPFATMTPIQAAYAVAQGRRPTIPPTTPRRLQEIIMACWDQDSYRRPSFTYVAMALADYAKMAFSPANVGALTLQIANEMLATVDGNSTVNVDFSTPVSNSATPPVASYLLSGGLNHTDNDSMNSDVGLQI